MDGEGSSIEILKERFYRRSKKILLITGSIKRLPNYSKYTFPNFGEYTNGKS
jgi:hypothetical protein